VSLIRSILFFYSFTYITFLRGVFSGNLFAVLVLSKFSIMIQVYNTFCETIKDNRQDNWTSWWFNFYVVLMFF